MENKLYYTFDNLKDDLKLISNKINESQFKIDVIIGPCRGAYIPGVMLVICTKNHLKDFYGRLEMVMKKMLMD